MIELTPVLAFQVMLVTVITIITLIPMIKKRNRIKDRYDVVINVYYMYSNQFFLPHE